MAVRHIFLDMDGVLSNFIAAAGRLHGRGDVLASWPLGVWDAPTVFRISPSQFWSKIDSAGSDFWADLEPYDWLHDLMAAVTHVAPFTILSAPSLGVECPSGKLCWLRKHFGSSFRDHLFGHQKHFCAKPGHVLIDDADTNVNRFREHGGDAILFPQPWNSNHAIAERVAFVGQELRRLQQQL